MCPIPRKLKDRFISMMFFMRHDNAKKKTNFFISFIHSLPNVTGTIASILAIIVFFNIGNLNDWREYIKSKPNSKSAVEAWKTDLESIRIGYSREHIESLVGIPQISQDIQFEESEFVKTTYINSYFTLICIYYEDSSLLGFLVIGNDDSFNLKNYRCGFSLFDYTINEAEQYCFEHGVVSYVMLNNVHSERLDCNSYYFECNYQHSLGAVSPYYIGYGICDIGAVESYSLYYDAAREMYQGEGSPSEIRDKSLSDDIRNFPINTFMIMEQFTFDLNSFIAENLMGFALGMGRDDFANLQPDYESCIKTFMENLGHDDPFNSIY